MAAITLDNTGTNAAAVSVPCGNAAILSGAGRDFIVANRTDSKVNFTLQPGTAVSLERGVGVAVPVELQPFEFRRIHLTKNAGTTAAQNNVTVAAGGVVTAHRTVAQNGESVFMVAETA